MTTFKIILQFNGKAYHGWQIQHKDTPTIQNELNKSLKKIFKEDIKTIGSGRTDAKVSSLDHHVVLKAPFLIPENALVKALNTHLPDDIRCIEALVIHDEFRPTNDAISKEYRYFFTTSEKNLVIARELMALVSYDLDLDRMRLAAKAFVGKYDFKNFHCLGSDPVSTIRSVTYCDIEALAEDPGGLLPQRYYLKIVGDGFLKQMVRLIMGAIWDVGRGRLEVLDIKNALDSNEFKHIAPVAPPVGLYKYKVQY